MARLKLPAYGKRLLAERRAGRHPLEINLCYGDRWREVAAPLIAIDPKDYEPGKYDFHVVAGLQVIVFDQLAGAAECDEKARPPTYGKFYDLLAELAAADALVEICWPSRIGWPPRDLMGLASAGRWFDRDSRSMQWPRWWNDALQEKQDRRFTRWTHDCLVRDAIEREHVQTAA